jgi:predicted Na+-dependent transporter
MLALLRRTWFFAGLAVIVFLGVKHPAVGLALKPWLNSFIFLGMLLIGLRLDFSDLLYSLKNARAIVICLICGFVAMPLLSLLLAHVFFGADRDMFVGIIIAGAVPTTQASSVVWTDISKGNRALALVLMSISNFVGVFVSPFILLLLLGHVVDLPVWEIMRTLCEFIFLPVVIGQIVKAKIGQVPQRVQFASRTTNQLIVWVAVLATLSSGDLLSLPLLTVAASVIIQYLSISGLSFFGSRLAGLSIDDSLAVMFCSAQVTLTFAAVIGFTYFAARSIIYVVVYHLFQQAMGQLTAQVSDGWRKRAGVSIAGASDTPDYLFVE